VNRDEASQLHPIEHLIKAMQKMFYIFHAGEMLVNDGWQLLTVAAISTEGAHGSESSSRASLGRETAHTYPDAGVSLPKQHCRYSNYKLGYLRERSGGEGATQSSKTLVTELYGGPIVSERSSIFLGTGAGVFELLQRVGGWPGPDVAK
jgi:hypothetical protein